MYNQNSIDTVNNSLYKNGLVRPAYGTYCFAHIPDTIRKLFELPSSHPLPADTLPDTGKINQVILILIDAFGWQYIEKFADELPFLKRLKSDGVINKTTSMFPSTTSAHVTCVNTGVLPGESGVHEWFYYDPNIDQIIAPILFSIPSTNESEWLRVNGVPPEWVYPGKTLYNELKQAGIPSNVFQSWNYANSTYSKSIMAGSTINGFVSTTEALYNLKEMVLQNRGRGYYYLYIDVIDSLAHIYGPNALQVYSEVRNIMQQLEGFVQDLAGKAAGTLLLITADHGQGDMDPDTQFIIPERIPEISSLLRKDNRGNAILFGGSPHDMFLYIQPEHIDRATALLKHELFGIANVFKTQEMINDGIFGPVVGQKLLERLGDIVVLSHNGQSVWWPLPKKTRVTYRGMHGGLIPEAMYTPFLALSLG